VVKEALTKVKTHILIADLVQKKFQYQISVQVKRKGAQSPQERTQILMQRNVNLMKYLLNLEIVKNASHIKNHQRTKATVFRKNSVNRQKDLMKRENVLIVHLLIFKIL